ncbi:MAG: TIGR03546 family protein [Nitrospirota bacterium]
MFRLLIRFIQVLNSEANPNQISIAFALSMIVGFTPTFSLHNLIPLFLVLLFRINLAAFILGFLTFTAASFLLDPLFHEVGMQVLTYSPFTPFFTQLYNIPLWRLEQFNNSIVMGSFILSLALFLPVHFLSKYLIVRYREDVLAWIKKTRLMQMIQANKLYHLYSTYNEWRNG